MDDSKDTDDSKDADDLKDADDSEDSEAGAGQAGGSGSTVVPMMMTSWVWSLTKPHTQPHLPLPFPPRSPHTPRDQTHQHLLPSLPS